METQYFTVVETAKLLKVSTSTVRRAVTSGALATTRVGSRGQIRIGQTALDKYLRREGLRGYVPRAPRVAETSALFTPVTPIAIHRGAAADGASWTVVQADVIAGLRALDDKSANCVVTSPPYYWQRDYEVAGQLGHEATIDGYVESLVRAFAECKRVLADDGLMFVNLGDTYYSAKGRAHGADKKHSARQVSRNVLRAVDGPGLGLPRKSLIGIPWRVALALQADGWTLRSAIVWYRPSSLPEPTAHDRPWRAHEYVFMFAKQPRYWFDRKQLVTESDVWQLTARPENPGSHFAPYPIELADRCISAGCRPGGTVLDPFVGSGTSMIAALRRGMPAIGIDIKREYCEFIAERLEAEFGSLKTQARKRA